MSCCLLILVFALGPRVMMAFMFLLTNWFSRAFETWMWPLLGFFFMPWTTLTYMGIMLNNEGNFSGFWLALFILAIIADIGTNGAAGSHRKSNRG